MWKPTKEGIYIHGGEYSRVMYPNTIAMWNEPAPRYCPDDFNPVTTCPDDWRRWQGRLTPVPDGPWSLLAPDWQPGAPTMAQLLKWPWWAVQWASGVIVVDCTDDEPGVAYAVARSVAFSKRPIAKSAPVQRDASNGPLWVPLEVTK